MAVALKPSEEVVAASFAVAAVLAVFSQHTPNLSDVKNDGANNDNTRRSIKGAVLTSAAIVSGIALLAKSPAVYIVGGLTIVIEGFQYAHANTLSHTTARPTTEVESGGS
jgi:hypothetical protein